MMIDTYITSCLSSASADPLKDVYFDTAARLISCAKADAWSEEDLEALAFLSKRIEISRCLYDSYLSSGGRASTRVLAAEQLTLALLLLVKDFQRLTAAGASVEAIKRLNAVLKLLDYLDTQKIVVEKELVGFIHNAAEQFLQSHRHAEPSITSAEPIENRSTASLPITVLFWEGPIARAYLATLKNMGLKPDRIIQLVAKRDLSSKKPVGRFLPGIMRIAYAQSRQKNSIHHWSGVLRQTEASLYQGMREQIEKGFGIAGKAIDDAIALRELSEYCPVVEQILVDDLADENLHRRLAALPEAQILFTGGGIVPKRLLELPHLKFIHVHPGHLPEVRGADCALWSQLMKGRTSATCFYMAPGIDDGDVILAAYMPVIRFNPLASTAQVKSLYRATYAFFDPWVRASVLRQAILATNGFVSVNAQPQSEDESVTYHFMHERIQQAAFARLFAEQ